MPKKKLNVAMIGYEFMGRAHSTAWRQVHHYFLDLPVEPVMKVVCGRTESKVKLAKDTLGWEEYATSWEDVLARKDIDIIDICTPGDSHVTIGIAAAQAGKAILCEKPLANTVAEARSMYDAVQKAGVVHMLCHNYRRCPAVTLAKQIIDSGQLGQIFHYRGTYLQDWIVDPNFPRVWRLVRATAGSGSLGDILSHTMDLSRYLVGEPVEVSGLTKTFIGERPLPEDPKKKGKVDVDDAALALVKYDNGALGYLEGTRFATGRKNYNRFEINCARGSLVWDLERMNELELYEEQGPNSGFRTINVTDAQASVRGGVVAVRTHHRLRALLHAHGLRFPQRRRSRQVTAAELRGRLEEPAHPRCHRDLGEHGAMGEDRVNARRRERGGILSEPATLAASPEGRPRVAESFTPGPGHAETGLHRDPFTRGPVHIETRLHRDHAQQRRPSDDQRTQDDESDPGRLRQHQPVLPAPLGKDERKDARHPHQVHQPDDQQHRSERPATAQAIQAMHGARAQRAGDATAEVVAGDECEGALALVEADPLPAGELIRTRDDQNRSGQRGQPARLRGVIPHVCKCFVGQQRHDADGRPDQKIGGDEEHGWKDAPALAPVHGEVDEHDRRSGRQHHRDHHRHPHRQEDADAHVALSEGTDLPEPHHHPAHRDGLLDRAGPGEHGQHQQHDDDREIDPPGQQAERRTRRIWCRGHARDGTGGRAGSGQSGPLQENGMCLLDCPLRFHLKPDASTRSTFAVAQVATAFGPTSEPGGLKVCTS